MPIVEREIKVFCPVFEGKLEAGGFWQSGPALSAWLCNSRCLLPGYPMAFPETVSGMTFAITKLHVLFYAMWISLGKTSRRFLGHEAVRRCCYGKIRKVPCGQIASSRPNRFLSLWILRFCYILDMITCAYAQRQDKGVPADCPDVNPSGRLKGVASHLSNGNRFAKQGGRERASSSSPL